MLTWLAHRTLQKWRRPVREVSARLTGRSIRSPGAAQGESNREIGARLFLSHRTVGYHLYKAYPKLGITARTQLAGVFARETRAERDTPQPGARDRAPPARVALIALSPASIASGVRPASAPRICHRACIRAGWCQPG
jgi:hypothetical protein